MGTAIAALILGAAILLFVGILRPDFGRGRLGRMQAFASLFIVPGLVTALATSRHLEQAKSTEFCGSCHVMDPYIETLHADAEWLPTVHYQNGWVPRDQACFSCHTTYTMFGDVEAKMKGLKHVLVNYFGTIPEEIELYEPYRNRECLSCHGGSRRLLEDDMHAEVILAADPEEVSCLECHDEIHPLDELAETPRWEPRDAL
jgi:nitrate/TMAO reductase-like tetraheme cytochrome c subunit